MSIDSRAVRLLILDVDGVLTDGTINIGPTGETTKPFNVRDGFGINLWQSTGRTIAIVTGRTSESLLQRAAELGIQIVRQGVKDKAIAIDQIRAELKINASQTACMGDDWPDLPAFSRAGYTIAPADADPAVIEAADFVTTRSGGRGAVREAIDHLLARENVLDELRARFIANPTRRVRP